MECKGGDQKRLGLLFSSEPKNANAYNVTGLCWYRESKYRRDIADYARAIELESSSANAYKNLAWLLATSPNEQYKSRSRAVVLAEEGFELTTKNIGKNRMYCGIDSGADRSFCL